MAIGWVRAYIEENQSVGTTVSFFRKHERSMFRLKFVTHVYETQSVSSAKLKRLKWGDKVELPDGLSRTDWSAVKSGSKTGFVKTSHLVEVAFVKRRETRKGELVLEAKMDYQAYDKLSKTTRAAKKKVIWGDLVQVISKGARRSDVRVRVS